MAPRYALLLLPPPPSPPSYAAIKAAYSPSITATLRKLVQSNDEGLPKLDIAVACYSMLRDDTLPRSRCFYQVQGLLAAIYRLVCITCAREGIEQRGQEGVDTAVIFLASDKKGVTSGSEESQRRRISHGPVIDLYSLASCHRGWNDLYAVEGEAGEQLLQKFMQLVGQRHTPPQHTWETHRVAGGTSFSAGGQEEAEQSRGSDFADIRHNAVAVGGTFDHLHTGHKLLLTMTAFLLESIADDSKYGRRMIVGISGDEMLKKKQFAEKLDSWDRRRHAVSDFICRIADFSLTRPTIQQSEEASQAGSKARVVQVRLHQSWTLECVEISDPFGPTITDESLTALVVSTETRSGGEAVNTRRAEKGWRTLATFEVSVVYAQEDTEDGEQLQQSFQNKISSTEIRKFQCEQGQQKN